MPPAAPSIVDEEQGEILQARIDAQDESFVARLREFLSSQGCQVFVNKQSSLTPRYHLVCGSAEFVKRIFDTPPQSGTKRLAIIWNGEAQSFQSLAHGGGKIAFVDPRPLTADSISSLFLFFFTSPATVLDLRKNPGQPMAEEEEQHLPQDKHAKLLASDEARVGQIISDIFKSTQHPKTHRRKRMPRWVSLVLSLMLLLLFPFLSYGITVTLAGGALGVGARLLQKGNIDEARVAVSLGRFWTRQAGSWLGVVGWPLRTIGRGETIRGSERLVSFFGDVAIAEEGLTQLVLEAGQTSALLFGQTAGGASPAAGLEHLRTIVASVHHHLGLARSQLTLLLADRPFPLSIGWVLSQAQGGDQALSAAASSAGLADQLLTLYPYVAGFKEKKTYLLLLQNSAELRPTGGFIGTIGLATVENGRMTDLTIQDVYTVDGQLKGHVDPPQALKTLLAQEHWYLRDSNWDPDFRISGEKAAWFYEKETGTVVDGVIAVSTPLVIELLNVTGPLDLPDYPDRITADNFLGKAIFYTQTDFFPGSTQKKDFLGSTTRALLTALTSTKRISAPKLFRAVANALASRDVQLYFRAPDVGNLVGQLGWGGSVFGRQGCLGQDPASCLFDPLFLAEANVSVNKANAFLARSRIRQVTFDEAGNATETLTLQYSNPSAGPPKDAGGSYRAYLQVVLPQGTTLDGVFVNGAAVNRSTNQPLPVPYWESGERGGHLVAGIALDVAASGQTQLTFSYHPAGILKFGKNRATYELFDQHQAGSRDRSFQTIVRYPIFWQAEGEGVAPGGRQGFLAKEAQLEYNTAIPADQFIRIRFTR